MFQLESLFGPTLQDLLLEVEEIRGRCFMSQIQEMSDRDIELIVDTAFAPEEERREEINLGEIDTCIDRLQGELVRQTRRYIRSTLSLELGPISLSRLPAGSLRSFGAQETEACIKLASRLSPNLRIAFNRLLGISSSSSSALPASKRGLDLKTIRV